MMQLRISPCCACLIDLEINEEADGSILLSDVSEAFPQGFADRIYQRDSSNQGWPSLGEMIEQDTQVLFFYNRGPEGRGYQPPGFNYFYNHAIATDWRNNSPQDIQQRALESCDLWSTGPNRDFFMFHAFVIRFVLIMLSK